MDKPGTSATRRKTTKPKPRASVTVAAPQPATEAAGVEPPRTGATQAAARAPGEREAFAGHRGRLRIYRHGLGDCLLLSFARKNGTDYRVLIDCGVILGTSRAADRMIEVAEDIVAVTSRKVDLLIITHEHWDHLSGFIQAEASLGKIDFGEVWVAWTEDPDDPLAVELRGEREQALNALNKCAAALTLSGAGSPEAETVHDMLGFFGAAGVGTTRTAFDKAKGKSRKLRFCRPVDPPVHLVDPDVRIYVMGPPPDAKLIRKTLASAKSAESYGLAVDGSGLFRPDVLEALSPDGDTPFDDIYNVPVDIARGDGFFRRYLWGDGPDAPGWRTIDTDWLEGASDLALALDSATNNTSLVLAFEFPDGDVALFVGDAQVGNWESWQTLSWAVDGRAVTGPDLLSRTTFYKVGHHGSHNATLRDNGLEAMDALKTAAIPVNHDMAVKKHWGQMPLPALVEALDVKTKGRTLRTDVDPPQPIAGVDVTPLYFDIAL